MSSIYLNSFWEDIIMYDEYYYVLVDLYFFTLNFLAPVAMHVHSTSFGKRQGIMVILGASSR